jgi:hypothetical protein
MNLVFKARYILRSLAYQVVSMTHHTSLTLNVIKIFHNVKVRIQSELRIF